MFKKTDTILLIAFFLLPQAHAGQTIPAFDGTFVNHSNIDIAELQMKIYGVCSRMDITGRPYPCGDANGTVSWTSPTTFHVNSFYIPGSFSFFRTYYEFGAKIAINDIFGRPLVAALGDVDGGKFVYSTHLSIWQILPKELVVKRVDGKPIPKEGYMANLEITQKSDSGRNDGTIFYIVSQEKSLSATSETLTLAEGSGDNVNFSSELEPTNTHVHMKFEIISSENNTGVPDYSKEWDTEFTPDVLSQIPSEVTVGLPSGQ